MRRKTLLAAALIASLGLLLALFGPDLVRIYATAYPWDLEHHAALMLCAQRDHLFMRFSAAERAACYRWALGRS
jgi:hypothetical protein